MTELEKRAITALRAVSMPLGNWHAHRVAWLYRMAMTYPDTRIDSTQAGDLWYLVWRYRRQIADHEVVMHACEIVNGAMSLAFQ